MCITGQKHFSFKIVDIYPYPVPQLLMLFDRTHCRLAVIHGGNIFAFRRATHSAVIQWLSGNDHACHKRGREFDPWTVQHFFLFY